MSEEIALASANLDIVAQLHAENAELHRALDVALTELERTCPTLIALGRQLGRCDMAFEIILGMKNAPDCHRTARRMRKEIKELTI